LNKPEAGGIGDLGFSFNVSGAGRACGRMKQSRALREAWEKLFGVNR
jgi:hypothetical protein